MDERNGSAALNDVTLEAIESMVAKARAGVIEDDIAIAMAAVAW